MIIDLCDSPLLSQAEFSFGHILPKEHVPECINLDDYPSSEECVLFADPDDHISTAANSPHLFQTACPQISLYHKEVAEN